MTAINDHHEDSAALRSAWLGLAALALAFGVMLGRRELVVFAIAGLLFHALARLYAGRVAGGFVLQRAAPERVPEGGAVRVELELRNASLLPAPAPTLVETLAIARTPTRLIPVSPGLLPGGAVRARLRVTCFAKRGRYAYGPALALGRDPLGLYSVLKPCATDPAATASVLVLPTPEPLVESHLEGAFAGLSGGLQRPVSGRGLDIQSIRDYRPGDPARLIHWPLSARRRELVIREFDQDLARRLVVVLDLPSSTLRGLGAWSTHEIAVRAAAGLIHRGLDDGEPVTLIALASSRVRLDELTGPDALAPALEALAPLRPRDDGPLAPRLRPELATLRTGSTVVLVRPLVEPDLPDLLAVSRDLERLGHRPHWLFIDGSEQVALHAVKRRRRDEVAENREACRALDAGGFTVTLLRRRDRLEEALAAEGDFDAPRIRVRPKSSGASEESPTPSEGASESGGRRA